MADFGVVSREDHLKGTVFIIQADGATVRILFLFHSLERIEKWEIETEKVIETLVFPEEVLTGHRDRYIAHRRYGNHIVRAVYEYEGNLPMLVTVYYPYTEKYYEGGTTYEDQIFKRS